MDTYGDFIVRIFDKDATNESIINTVSLTQMIVTSVVNFFFCLPQKMNVVRGKKKFGLNF